MNRRIFLTGIAATAAGILVPQAVLAEPERRVWALDQTMTDGRFPSYVSRAFSVNGTYEVGDILELWNWRNDREIAWVYEVLPEHNRSVVIRNMFGSEQIELDRTGVRHNLINLAPPESLTTH